MASSDSELNLVLTSTTPSGITTITINRPDRRNAVDIPTARKLYAAFQAFDADPNQKVCVFTGADGTFCAGADLHALAKFNDQAELSANNMPSPVSERNSQGPMGPSRMQLSKPVICAVAGYAVAGGLELSLLGDVRIAEEDAVFGVFCRRWGVPLIDGGTVRLQAIVGLGRALDMILTGRPVDAKEALAMGLANRVVPKGQGLAAAVELAEQLLVFPQGCMNVDRESCYASAFDMGSFQEAMAREFERGKTVMAGALTGAGRFSGGMGRHGSFDRKAKL